MELRWNKERSVVFWCGAVPVAQDSKEGSQPTFAPLWNRIPKNEENHGGKRSWSNPGKTGHCIVLESIIEKWGKKDLAKTTPKIGENKKTRGQ